MANIKNSVDFLKKHLHIWLDERIPTYDTTMHIITNIPYIFNMTDIFIECITSVGLIPYVALPNTVHVFNDRRRIFILIYEHRVQRIYVKIINTNELSDLEYIYITLHKIFLIINPYYRELFIKHKAWQRRSSAVLGLYNPNLYKGGYRRKYKTYKYTKK